MKDITDKIQEIINQQQIAAVCTVVHTKGSTPLKAGAKMIVYEDGRIYATIGGGSLEHSVIQQAIRVIKKEEPETFTHNLVKDHHMACGGTVTVFIEPIPIPYPLYIFGAGHLGEAVCEHTRNLNFDVTLIDDRQGIFDNHNLDTTRIKTINLPLEESLPQLNWSGRSFCVLVYYNHELERQILRYALKQPSRYIGLLASKRKAAFFKKSLLENHGILPEEFAQVDAPIGTNIRAETAHELAVSIVSKLIMVKNSPQTAKKQSLTIQNHKAKAN